MGEDRFRRTKEIAILQRGIDLGMGQSDAAEMYGEGLSEELVGEAIRGPGDALPKETCKAIAKKLVSG